MMIYRESTIWRRRAAMNIAMMAVTFCLGINIVTCQAPSNMPSMAFSEVTSDVPTAHNEVESMVPTLVASDSSSEAPSMSESNVPTILQSLDATSTTAPSIAATVLSSDEPALTASEVPTIEASIVPTGVSSVFSSEALTETPTILPSQEPSSQLLSNAPSEANSLDASSSIPTLVSSIRMSNDRANVESIASEVPTSAQTEIESEMPTTASSELPTVSSTMLDSSTAPSIVSSEIPTMADSIDESNVPTTSPTATILSDMPSISESGIESATPSEEHSTISSSEMPSTGESQVPVPSTAASVLLETPSILTPELSRSIPPEGKTTMDSSVPTLAASESLSNMPSQAETLPMESSVPTQYTLSNAPSLGETTIASSVPTLATSMMGESSEVPTIVASSEVSQIPTTRTTEVPSAIPSQETTLDASSVPTITSTMIDTSNTPSTVLELPSESSEPSFEQSLGVSQIPSSSATSSVPTSEPISAAKDTTQEPSATKQKVSASNSLSPSNAPTMIISSSPSNGSSPMPSIFDSSMPSKEPSSPPTMVDSAMPSIVTSSVPSSTDSSLTSSLSSLITSNEPSLSPSRSVQPSSVPSETPTFEPIGINCGGSSYTDSNGFEWIGDSGFFNTGRAYTARGVAIENTIDQALYRSERYDVSSGEDLVYSIPIVPNGEYEVTLLFSENYSGAQKENGRVFSVSMEGEMVFQSIDIFVESGGPFQAMNRTAIVPIMDGELNILFTRQIQNPKVSGIFVQAVASSELSVSPSLAPSSVSSNEVSEGDSQAPTIMQSDSPSGEPSLSPSSMPSGAPSIIESETPSYQPSDAGTFAAGNEFVPIYINAGGDSFVDSNGITWDADNYFNTGNDFTAKGSVTGDVDDDKMYLSERWDPSSGDELVYEIPNIPDGDYEVTLFFSENYVTSVGARVFNVAFEGEVVSNVDIFEQAGGQFKPTSMTRTVSVSDGGLTLEFFRVTENPKISGIRVVSASESPKGNPPNQMPSMLPSESSVPSQTPSTLPSNIPSDVPSPVWIDKDEDENYTARHECSFVQAGDKFFMFGGREQPMKLDAYDYTSDTWSVKASPPLPFNHFQAVEFEGLVWVIGSFRDNDFPNEAATEDVYVYDPANDNWIKGPEIPSDRRRGGGGLQVYNGKFYLVGGNTNGHNAAVPWLDEFNPQTGEWTPLDDAPHARDHFHAVVIGDRLYAAGGRRSATDKGVTFNDTVPEVDVYDFLAGEWIESALPDDLQVPRAAAATVAFDGKVMLAGGESGDSMDAHDDVHALDPTTGQWERLASLNHARHGTQAIVSGEGVYVAGGSPLQGDGSQKNMEVYERDAPEGGQSTAGVLSAPAEVTIEFNEPATAITLQHVSGNQGVFVQSVSLSGATANDFVFVDGDFVPLLIRQGSSLDVNVRYLGLMDGATAQLDVMFSGSETISIPLIGSSDPSDSHAPSSQPSLSQPTSRPPFDSIYINCGGGEFIDSNDITWLADSFFNTGNKAVVQGSVTGNTVNDELYLSERWDPRSGEELVYDIPHIPDGEYEVILHFSETYVSSVGARVFNVSMEGEAVFSNVDIFQESGGQFQVLTRSTLIFVSGGSLEIKFTRITENPCVSGIEIHAVYAGNEASNKPSSTPSLSMYPSTMPSSFPSETASQAPSLSSAPSLLPSMNPSQQPSAVSEGGSSFTPVYINAGSNTDYTDSNGDIWIADAPFANTGVTYRASSATIQNTLDQELYRSERYDLASGDDLVYSIPGIPAGEYEVTLLFSENYGGAQKEDGRVFDVSMEGVVVFQRVDIFVESGGPFRAMNKTKTVTVLDGELNIGFLRGEVHVQNPKVSGISVRAVATVEEESQEPSSAPSNMPSSISSGSPSVSQEPTIDLSDHPSGVPSNAPTTSIQPSLLPSEGPSATTLATEFEPIGINCGGSLYTDSNGFDWIADAPFANTGETYKASSATIQNTADQELFKSERYDLASGEDLVYSIPDIPPGEYKVTLLFSENYSGAQKENGRVFSVSMEGEMVFQSVDIFVESGGPFQAMNRTAIVSVTDGELNILFTREIQNPKVSGILIQSLVSGISISPSIAPSSMPTNEATYDSQAPTIMLSHSPSREPSLSPSSMPSGTPSSIRTASPSAQAMATIRINAGSNSEYTDSDGKVWSADSGFNTGRQYTASGVPIGGTEDDSLFRSERYDLAGGDDLTYEIPVPAIGDYEVTLYFAENYATEAGVRVFDVFIENDLKVPALDIYAESGGMNQAMSKTTTVSVTDGSVSISFGRILQNPKISAIAIAALTAGASSSSDAPSSLPSESMSPSLAPSGMPSDYLSPSFAPSGMPSVSLQPTMLSETDESSSPSSAPSSSAVPSLSPTNMPSIAPVGFEPIYINAGGNSPILDPATGITWEADNHYNTGKIASTNKDIIGASFEAIYQVERFDSDEYPNLQYDIPLPDGRFEVKLHFADTWKGTWAVGARVFNVYIEGKLELENFDIYAEVGKNKALVKSFVLDVSDGELNLMFEHGLAENPKINAISIESVGNVKPHYAHAVPGGPYFAVDTDNTGDGTVSVNGFFSHTHAPGAQLTSWTWKIDDVEVAYGEQADITLGVGEHILVLKVEDSVGDSSEDFTTVTVEPYGYPFIESLTPSAGDMIGGDKIIITGSGFDTPQTVVNFGSTLLSGPSEITIVDDTTVEVLANPQNSWGKVEVTVTTPLSTSNPVEYEYLPEIPLTFKSGDLAIGSIFGPTTAAFSPDGNLYVATQGGYIMKYVLDETHNILDSVVSSPALSAAYPFRAILGLTFDPMDPCLPPNGCKAYVSHSTLYHGQLTSFNGAVSTVSGPDLDIVEDVVLGLPISDHDHGVNGLEFDDHGNLYIQVGGNTNAGVPGALSTSQLQKEDLFSAATLIARNVNSPSFDGNITYDANGDQLTGWDVSVYASGMRNPYGITLHSNGRLYGTDNGPNFNFGKTSLGCDDEQEAPDPFEPDKLNLIEEGNFYGHPNRKRGETDPRQCSFRSAFVPSEGYTLPIKKLDSSSNGIVEFQSNHFGGALRGDLIIGRYKQALYHVKLTSDGLKAAGAVEDEPPELLTEGGLDVTQGPDGSLFSVSNFKGEVRYHSPDEEEAELMTVKSIYPRRGPIAGGSTLTIYGQKMFNATDDPNVTVGGLECPVTATKIYTDITSKTMQWIKCTLPPGVGSSDVVVTFESEVYTFSSYRYITGEPIAPVSESPSQSPSSVSASENSDAPSSAPTTPSPWTEMPSAVPTRAPSEMPVPSSSAIFVNAGVDGEDITAVSGTTAQYEKTVGIDNTQSPEYFQTHRWGTDFTYTFDGLVALQSYSVTLGFAEIWEPNCDIGMRIMEVSMNGNVVDPDLDIFKEQGCTAAYIETWTVQATSLGEIAVRLRGVVENAMVSFIEIV